MTLSIKRLKGKDIGDEAHPIGTLRRNPNRVLTIEMKVAFSLPESRFEVS